MKSEGNIIGFASLYYHSDHLGSSAYLTDDSGQVTQILNYLPYGEDWVDIQNNLDPSLGQYTFNGKEKDYESGFHYYGARYYWSEVLTGWLSVDPMADKYPSVSPYAYCAWNPVRLVDLDGMKFDSIGQIEVDKLKKETIRKMYKRDILSAIYRDEYMSTLDEIHVLEESNQTYSIQNRNGGFKVLEKKYATGITFYGVESNIVRIVYNGDIGTLAHELKHAYQFEIGNISFDKSGKNGDLLYDFYDEREAFNRGSAYGRPTKDDNYIQKHYTCTMTNTTVDSKPKSKSIIDILNARENIYRKDGETYKSGVKVIL